MLDACATLDAESLVRDMGLSFESVLVTLEHDEGTRFLSTRDDAKLAEPKLA